MKKWFLILICVSALTLFFLNVMATDTNTVINIKATIIDRDGNRFEVTDLSYMGTDYIRVYRGDMPVGFSMQDISKIEFQGDRKDEKQPVRLKLTTSEVMSGYVQSSTLENFGYGFSQNPFVFTGKTNLGKFTIALKDTKEILFHHEKKRIMVCPVDKKQFDQEGYKFCPYDGTKLEPMSPDSTAQSQSDSTTQSK